MSTTATNVAQSDQVNGTIPTIGGAMIDTSKHYNNWPNEPGFNAPVETHTPIELKVQGHFPPYVSGKLMRTGPGTYKFPSKNAKDGYISASHWFDGFTQHHSFTLTPTPTGTPHITYSSRIQCDEKLERARATGRLDGISFGQKRDPCDSFFKKLKSVWEPVTTGPRNVNIGVAFQPPITAGRKGCMTATSDQAKFLDFDAETLEPLGVTSQEKLHPSLNGELSAAHPNIDPETGDVYNYNLKFGPKPVYRTFCLSAATGTATLTATITGLDACYLHSQFLTQNFHILCIWPARFALGGASILWTRDLLSAMQPFDEKNTKVTWLVIDRRYSNGVVARFESPPFFAFHTVNAWETTLDDGKVDVTAELVTHKNMDVLRHFYYDSLVSSGPSAKAQPNGKDLSLARYRLPSIPLPTATSKPRNASTTKATDVTKLRAQAAQLLHRHTGPKAPELPTLNPSYALRPHRYVYGIADRGLSTFADALVKTDAASGESTYWHAEGHTPGEPIFVANPAAGAESEGVVERGEEDKGVLLSVVLDGVRGTSYLLCLDARTMEEVGRAEVGCAVGLGFHGVFLQS